ncbi:MAG TPA: (Fe-S)-binding protein [Actinobacteria bacterium]|nr:lactate utilization protein A [bacterium BMS3Bbin01]HDH26116.1 (Fe-S)-binding protein [Actinomycetota bacterium]
MPDAVSRVDPESGSNPAEGGAEMTVQLFVTCLVDAFAPEVGRAVVKVLEDHGLTVGFPFDQTCCGQPAFNAGHRDEARAMAERTVKILDDTDGPIVIPSGSCAAMMIGHYRDLLSGRPELVAAGERVARRVREFTQFLVDDLGLQGIGGDTPGPIVFHPSCHGLRYLSLRGYGEKVLDIAGIERCELSGAEECCGFGGLFAVEMPEVSTAIMDTKLTNVEASGAQTLVGYDLSCLMHLAGGLHRRGSQMQVRHIAELLTGKDQA